MPNVISVGFALHPALGITEVPHDSQASLDDGDIVLFSLPVPPHSASSYQGKPSLAEGPSFQYREILRHWNREIGDALRGGTTVFAFAEDPSEVFVDTGRREHSGTGRSRQTTLLVELETRHSSLPFKLPVMVAARGTEMRLLPAADIISTYWKKFGAQSRYEVRFDAGEGWTPLVATKSGRRMVAALLRVKGGGHAVILPPPHLLNEESDRWTAKERRSCAQFVEEVVAIDSQLRSDNESTPAPTWTEEPAYTTATMDRLRAKLGKIDSQQERLRQTRERVASELRESRELQLLLHGTGKPLERSVHRALRLMGFDAKSYQDGESEFDVVFTADNKRMLGEVEGRDRAAIAIGKVTQLERNIAEDFARPSVRRHARGVLFGNPQRLVEPEKRDLDFTAKCKQSAVRNKFALVLTCSLYEPAAYLEGNDDRSYAKACRQAIWGTEGAIVTLPPVPGSDG